MADPRRIYLTYRLDQADYLEMVAAGCALCRVGFTDALRPVIDHDHACDHPGRGRQSCRACVRGVLCDRCNLQLGRVENGFYGPTVMEKAYLRRTESGAQALAELDKRHAEAMAACKAEQAKEQAKRDALDAYVETLRPRYDGTSVVVCTHGHKYLIDVERPLFRCPTCLPAGVIAMST